MITTPCREYQGTKDGYGYGWRKTPDFHTAKVHRQIMAMVYGEDEIREWHVLHHCDNPPCFRFDHLYLGTQADNHRDMHARGRWTARGSKITHCPQGHEYSEENTRLNNRGARLCIICTREAVRRSRLKRRKQ